MTALSASAKRGDTSSVRYGPFGAVLVAAILWAFAPPIIHLTAADTNPFYYNLTVILVEGGLLALFLLLTADRHLRAPLSKIDARRESELRPIGRKHKYLSHFLRSTEDTPRVTLGAFDFKTLRTPKQAARSMMRLPLLWCVIGTLHYGFFAWSTHYIETAIATSVYELWPFFLILLLARHHRVDEAYRLGAEFDEQQGSSRIVAEVIILSIIAAIGLTLISVSQHDPLTVGSLSWDNAKGLVLAAGASVLHSLWIAGTLVYGRTIYYRMVEPALGDTEASKAWSKLPVHKRSRDHRRLLLWSTIMGIVVARLLALPITLAVGRLVFDSDKISSGASLTARGLIGAMILGLVGASSATLRRLGDIASTGPGVHALAFLTPPLSLLFLWALGIDLPRRDVFVIGAALIVASNILIQARPDQHRDLTRFGLDSGIARGRLGFTAFIIAIWLFGSAIYARDHIVPVRWLEWNAGGYWSIIALSATVFALILGFRVARLTSRISREDEVAVHLFRDCEHLVRRDYLSADAIENLRALDMTRSRDLMDAYTSLREDVRHKIQSVSDPDDYQVLRSVEVNLDVLCHIKQQGRDIVELISMSGFALVTISLGLFARPSGLQDSDAVWSAFLSESFVLIFVSTVAFLWINLFDMRRERGLPTLVPVKSHDGDYGVYFRYDPDLRVKHVAAVLISVAMAATFVILLSDKWLEWIG